MQNPFRWWENDPSGWGRHLFVGVCFGIIIALTPESKRWGSVVALVFLAFGKEVYDHFFRAGWEAVDVLLTLFGALPGMIRNVKI